MSNSTQEKNGCCAICLQEFNDPIPVVTLPCNHQYCLVCLEGWRSKYGSLRAKTCPQRRSKIPPTKEMVSQLRTNEMALSLLQKQLDSLEPLPLPAADDSSHNDNSYVSLPDDETRRWLHRMDPETQQETLRELLRAEIYHKEARVNNQREQVDGFENILSKDNEEEPFAGARQDIPKVLEWLDSPVPERLNAKNPDKCDRTLLHEAEFEGHTELMRLQLQSGAKVDPKSSFGKHVATSLCIMLRDCCGWGADTFNPELVREATSSGIAKLARLLQTDSIGWPSGRKKEQI